MTETIVFQSCNLDKALIKSGGRKSTAHDLEVLKSKIQDLWVKSFEAHEKPTQRFDEDNSFNPEFLLFNAKIEKDLAKVQFDTENLSWNEGTLFTIKKEHHLVGLHVLSNGLPIYGMMAGGDWETPLYFIVYYDGKALRGYIPSYGNTHNVDFKCTLGSEEDCELYYEKKASQLYPHVNFDGFEAFNDKYDLNDAAYAYLVNQGVDLTSLGHFTPDWQCIEEDIIHRIVMA